MTEDLDPPTINGIDEPERSEYLRLFNLAKNQRNWRMPLHATIKLTPEEIPKMKEAIRLITGSRDVDIHPYAGTDGEYVVSAEGNYNATTL